MSIRENIGFIGTGNMGSAILEGLLKKGIVKPDQVWIFDRIQEKATALEKKWAVHLASGNKELVKRAGVILLAVKPQDLKETVHEFTEELKRSHLLISVLAGTPINKISELTGAKTKIVRAMPNLGAKVGEGITALAGSDDASLSTAKEVFSGCGKTVILDEKHFDLVTALSGSGPAYFFLLMELMVKEGVQNGLSQKEAETLAVQTAVGAGLLAQSSDCSPEKLRRMVTSKGGTTEAALKILENQNFEGLFRKALRAACQRGRELSQS